MLHKNVLELLFPAELNGVFKDDTELEGKYLDASQTRVEDLLKEIFPDETYELLTGWERVTGLTPGADEPLKSRRDKVIRKLRELGGLSRQYFVDLAASMGYTIEIEELQPFMAGWGRAGDPVYVEGVRFVWRVKVSGQSLCYFRAGESTAGEKLLWWDAQTVLENLFNEFKPAHTFIIFDYS
jgi:uncharacterized protein YmfQ (DUF2313 family)